MKTPAAYRSAIIEGLFARIKSLVLALHRHDRLETAQDFNGWFERLTENREEIADIALHMTLRAIHVASEPTNFRLLQRLQREQTVSLRSLMNTTGMSRVPVHDRINTLMQAGLAVQELESDDVRITPLGEGVVRWLEELIHDLERSIYQWLNEGKER